MVSHMILFNIKKEFDSNGRDRSQRLNFSDTCIFRKDNGIYTYINESETKTSRDIFDFNYEGDEILCNRLEESLIQDAKRNVFGISRLAFGGLTITYNRGSFHVKQVVPSDLVTHPTETWESDYNDHVWACLEDIFNIAQDQLDEYVPGNSDGIHLAGGKIVNDESDDESDDEPEEGENVF